MQENKLLNYTIDKAMDVVIDYILQKSKEEIDEKFNDKYRKKILKNALDKFAVMCSDISEYKNISYELDTNALHLIDVDRINPILGVDVIASEIKNLVDKSYYIPDDIDLLYFTKLIASYYKKRAFVSTQLCEVAHALENQHDEIMGNFDEIKSIINRHEETQLRVSQKRKYIYKTYIQKKIDKLIYDYCNFTYHLIFKCSPQVSSEEDFFTKINFEINARKEKLSRYIDIEYWKKPINIITLNPNGSIEPLNIKMSPAKFIKDMFVPQIDLQVKEIMKDKEVIPEEIYYELLNIDYEIHNGFFAAIMVFQPLMDNVIVTDINDIINSAKMICEYALHLAKFHT